MYKHQILALLTPTLNARRAVLLLALLELLFLITIPSLGGRPPFFFASDDMFSALLCAELQRKLAQKA